MRRIRLAVLVASACVSCSPNQTAAVSYGPPDAAQPIPHPPPTPQALLEEAQRTESAKREKAGDEHLAKGKRLLEDNKELSALDEFAKIPGGSQAYDRAVSLVKETLAKVTQRLGDQCTKILDGDERGEALYTCERYFQLRCETPARTDLLLPEGKQLKLDGPLGKNGWRPPDGLFVRYLRARAKEDPGAPPWGCVNPARGTDRSDGRFLPESCARVSRLADAGYDVDALTVYCEGKAPSEKKPDPKLAASMARVDKAYQEGQRLLAADQLEKAAEPFREAMTLDAELLAFDERIGPVSYYRHHVQRDFTSRAYAKGKQLADRNDPLGACAVWTLGLSFWKGNLDLDRAIDKVCDKAAGDRQVRPP